MSPTITTAVFGLVGVTVGAVMQAATARVNRMRDHRLSLADYRRDKREAVYLKVLRHVDRIRRSLDEDEEPRIDSGNRHLDPDLSVEFNLYANALTQLAYYSLQLCWARMDRYEALNDLCQEVGYTDIGDQLKPLSSQISLAIDDQELVLHSAMQDDIIGNEFWQIKYQLRRLRRRKFDTRQVTPEELESIDELVESLGEEVTNRLEKEDPETTVESATTARGLSNGLAERVRRLTRRSRRDTST